MARPRMAASACNDRTREEFEQHLWKAVERGSVVAMKLWADLHREEFQPKDEDVSGGLFTPVGDAEDA